MAGRYGSKLACLSTKTTTPFRIQPIGHVLQRSSLRDASVNNSRKASQKHFVACSSEPILKNMSQQNTLSKQARYKNVLVQTCSYIIDCITGEPDDAR